MKRANRLKDIVILVELCVIVFLIVWRYIGSPSYSIIFENENVSEEKIEQANSNVVYMDSEYKYMTIYSYPTDVVFAGDSLTYRCPWNEIFPDLNVKNRGIGSDTTEGLLARTDSIVKTKPAKIFLMIGINDLGRGLDQETIVYNYECLIDEFQNDLPETELYVQSILPVSETVEVVQPYGVVQLNDELQEMCERHDIHYVNLYDSFADAEGYMKAEYVISDGVHLTEGGYELWRNLIADDVYR